MSPQEMIVHCEEQQRLQNKPDATAGFMLRGRWGKSSQKRLFPGGPLGDIVSEVRGRVYVLFKADEVIASLSRHQAPAHEGGGT